MKYTELLRPSRNGSKSFNSLNSSVFFPHTRISNNNSGFNNVTSDHKQWGVGIAIRIHRIYAALRVTRFV